MLLGGAAIGLLCAAVAIVKPWEARENSLSPSVAARVNNVVISADTYRRALGRLAADSKDPLDSDQRQWVLERLIEEELLIQRGLAMDLPENEKAVRAAIVRALIASITAEAESKPVDDVELRRFYSQNAALFAHSARIRMSAIRFMSAADAEGARKRIEAGEMVAVSDKTVSDKTAGRGAAPLVPDAMLPLPKLREYLGPAAIEAAAALAPGEVSHPIPSGDGFLIVRIVEKQPDQVPAFEAVRDEVMAAYRKNEGDAALRAYLERLKRHATIQRNRALR